MAGNGELPVVTQPAEPSTQEQLQDLINKGFTRRTFVQGMGVAGLGVVAMQYGCSTASNNAQARQVYVPTATGLVLANPNNCVGCRRCEAACVGNNQGNYATGNNPATVATTSDTAASTMAQPAISNIKVNRNLLYGQGGPKGYAATTGTGLYGDFMIVANTCKQCPHPVPCQLACPHGAIQVLDAEPRARVIDTSKCKGCGICVEACPWAMPSLDGAVLAAGTKAHKCHLCGGAPECVAACTAQALTYIPWTDTTSEAPRQAVPASIQLAPDVAGSCAKCH
jgi:Fe-S-cluster-containing hydrogenase component 2